MRWEEAFTVRTAPDAPPMLGEYVRRGRTLVFRPRFSVSPGLEVVATFRGPDGRTRTLTFAGEGRAAEASTQVSAVYPTAGVLPANILKFYIEFSAPMARGEAFSHIRLLDEAGRPVGAFVEAQDELWDADSRRLTVLFEPGRIKRGVADNLTMGPPMREGGRYTLQIDPGFKDARGAGLTVPYSRTFMVTPAVRLLVDPSSWRLAPPKAPSDPLIFDFPRPLDAALLKRAITVSRDGARIEGRVILSRLETRWAFMPTQPWKAGRYNVDVDPILEDLAGNRVDRLFDTDPAAPAPRKPPTKLAFEVKP